MIKPKKKSLLLVISGPSGAGKTTLCERLLSDFKQMVPSVSCTTRPPRAGEKDGKDYHFLTKAEFKRRVGKNYFLEHAKVHGEWYGTPKTLVVKALKSSSDALLAIDVQGAARIRALTHDKRNSILKKSFVDVFIVPPDIKTLRQRMEKRGKDSPAVIGQRMKTAREEMGCRNDFQYLVINDVLQDAYIQLRMIVCMEHCWVK